MVLLDSETGAITEPIRYANSPQPDYGICRCRSDRHDDSVLYGKRVLSCHPCQCVRKGNLTVNREGFAAGNGVGWVREDGQTTHGATDDDGGHGLVPLYDALPQE
jgi:hypothetical protein